VADPEPRQALRVGVLALQGDFEAHAKTLRQLGAEPREVRTPAEMEGLDALVIPGGESTTIGKMIESVGLEPALRGHFEAGRPILGTCAGLIVCDAEHLGFLDATARRNAFGRQLQSFEADLEVEGVGDEPLRAVFIRAPWVERHGAGVEVLGSHEGHPVAIRDGNVLACAFHPELTDDSRFHAIFMAMATAARERAGEEANA
jgi:5'-phosphate synthase pdxT subunit